MHLSKTPQTQTSASVRASEQVSEYQGEKQSVCTSNVEDWGRGRRRSAEICQQLQKIKTARNIGKASETSWLVFWLSGGEVKGVSPAVAVKNPPRRKPTSPLCFPATVSWAGKDFNTLLSRPLKVWLCRWWADWSFLYLVRMSKLSKHNWFHTTVVLI